MIASSLLLLWTTDPDDAQEYQLPIDALSTLQDSGARTDTRPQVATAPQQQVLELPPLNLQRSLEAGATELWIDQSDDVGPCSGDTPLLPHLTAEACFSLHCMWSYTQQANIDLWFSALMPLDPNVLDAHCAPPRGGQLPAPHGQHPAMSIVLLADADDKLAAQTLLEAFRVARELPSAEIIVLARLPPATSSLLSHTADRLHAYFGTRVALLRPPPGQPPSADVTQALATATAKHALLLRTGAFVTRGALATLLATLQGHKDAAVVGPMLVTGRNVVADGGGVLFSDGSSLPYARGAAPSHSASFLRPVDFLSTACLLTDRAAMLAALQHLDITAPSAATELAAFMADVGLQMLYQPLAVVRLSMDPVSAAGAPSPAPPPVGLGALAQQAPGLCQAGTDAGVAARRVLSPKVVWVIDSLDFGGVVFGLGRRLLLMQAMLQAGYDVTLQPVVSMSAAHVQQARFMGVDVRPLQSPLTLQLDTDGVCRYDGVIVSNQVFAATKQAIAFSCPKAPVVCDVPDLQFVREARQLLSVRHVASWDFAALSKEAIHNWLHSADPAARPIQALRDRELGAAEGSHTVVLTDTVQQQIFQAYRPDARTRVVGAMFPPSSSRQPCEARQGLLFVASNDTAATQLASHWLLLALVPQILARLPKELRPGFVVHIVGRVSLSPTAQEAAEQLQRVYVHDELEPAAMQLLYDSVKVVAAPFATSSFRAEVLQAMMFRVPMVATPTAVEGLRVAAGEDCKVAGSFQEFVKQAVAVYSSCEAWERLSRLSYELVQARHSQEALQLEWLHMMRDAGVGPVPRDLRRDCHDGDAVSS